MLLIEFRPNEHNSETNEDRTFKFGTRVLFPISLVSLKFGTNWSSGSGTTHTNPKTLKHIFKINTNSNLKFDIRVFFTISFVSPKLGINWSSTSLRSHKI